MQLHLTLESDCFCLPINYRQLIHGLIYRALSGNPAFSEDMHDKNKNVGETRVFKGFTFSELRGSYTVAEKTIRFDQRAKLEIRSYDPVMIGQLHRYFSGQKTVTLGHSVLTVAACDVTELHMRTSHAAIRMITPAVAYRTDESRHTEFFKPDEPRFYEALIRNAERKNAVFQPDVPFALSICRQGDALPKRLFTCFKKTYIMGWYGSYILEGTPEVIDLLYQVGLGAKNSEGFGMFTARI